MSKNEAKQRIASWIQQHSPFLATVVSATARENGSWEVQVRCSEVIWTQIVGPTGEVSPPVWIEEERTERV